MKKILLLPGWMTYIKLYKKHDNFRICFGKMDKESFSADYVVGVSLGTLVVLRDIRKIKGKIILINPPLPHKSFFVWFKHWLRFVKDEGLFWERQKFTLNPVKFLTELARCIKLLNIDFSNTLDTFRDKITVLRGKEDVFFCNDEAVRFLLSKNIKVVEYDGGHNLSKIMEETLNSLIK